MTDQDLLRAYVDSRDPGSLSAFMGRYQESLVRFVTNLLQDDRVAQDIVQQTFLRVARRPQRLLGVGNCHNWLLAVARNLSVDHLRRVMRQRDATRAGAAEQDLQGVAVGSREAASERGEAGARVRAELRCLGPPLRELVLLKLQEEKSYREIAEITGLSVTSVGHLLHQGMNRLTGRLMDLRGC